MKYRIGNISRLVLLAFGLFVVSSAKAQMNMAFYPFEEQFNSDSFNPAFLNPQHRFTFSFSPLGGMSVGYNNQETVNQMVTKFLQGNTTDQAYRDLLQSLADRPTFNQTLESTLISFTCKSKLGHLNFRISEHENFSVAMKGSLTNFVFKRGIRQAEVGVNQYLPAQGMHYREYSIGYSLPEKHHKFTGGIRVKWYFGKGAFSSGLSGMIQKDGSDYRLRAEGKVLISIPEINGFNPDGPANNISLSGSSNTTAYLMNRGNLGFGLDLGFKYEPTPELSFSASVIDLGKINWRTNLNSRYLSGEYPIDGKTVSSTVLAGGNEIITKIDGKGAISDSISNLFQINYNHSPFSLRMPVSVYTGIKYRLTPGVTIHLTDRYVILKNMNYNSLALTADFDVNNRLSVNTGYAMIAGSWINIPLAFLFKRAFGQIYVGTDNLAAFVVPSLSEFAGLSFGTCFYLFRRNEPREAYSRYFPFFKRRKIRSDSRGLFIGRSPT
jgi:hypothetical protein